MIFILFCQMKMQYDLNLKNKKKNKNGQSAGTQVPTAQREGKNIYSVCACAYARMDIYDGFKCKY